MRGAWSWGKLFWLARFSQDGELGRDCAVCPCHFAILFLPFQEWATCSLAVDVRRMLAFGTRQRHMRLRTRSAISKPVFVSSKISPL